MRPTTVHRTTTRSTCSTRSARYVLPARTCDQRPLIVPPRGRRALHALQGTSAQRAPAHQRVQCAVAYFHRVHLLMFQSGQCACMVRHLSFIIAREHVRIMKSSYYSPNQVPAHWAQQTLVITQAEQSSSIRKDYDYATCTTVHIDMYELHSSYIMTCTRVY